MNAVTVIAIWLSDPVVLCWILFAVSVFATAIHTVDEIVAEGGPLWNYLAGEWLRIPYFVFQGSLIVLAWFAYQDPGISGWLLVSMVAGWVLIIARMVDFGFTHQVLAIWKRPNPGQATCLLLFADAVFILLFQIGALL